MNRSEEIAFHKGVLRGLQRQREQLLRTLNEVEQSIQMHTKAIQDLSRAPDGDTRESVSGREVITLAEIKPSYRCNQNCIICPYHDLRGDTPMSYAEVIDNLQFLKKRFRFNRLILSGGEPTVYPHFFEILEWVRQEMPDTVMVVQTNGVKIAEAEFAYRLRDYPVEFFVSFHAPDEEINSAVTGRKGHFRLLTEGIHNIIKIGKPVTVNVVITKQNENRLRDINIILSGLGVRSIEYRLCHLTGRVHPEEYMPDILRVVQRINSSLRYLTVQNARVNITNIPYCLIDRKHLRLPEGRYRIVFIDRARQFEDFTEGDVFESAISDRFYENRKKVDTCRRCDFDQHCPGVDHHFWEQIDDLTLVPVEGLREQG